MIFPIAIHFLIHLVGLGEFLTVQSRKIGPEFRNEEKSESIAKFPRVFKRDYMKIFETYF